MDNFKNRMPFEKDSWVLYKSVTAGSGDDGEVELSAAIANDGSFDWLKALVVGLATLTSEKTATVALELHECATTGGSYTKYKDITATLVLDDTGSGVCSGAINVTGAKAFVKIGVKTTLSHTETDTFVYQTVATKQALTVVEK